LLSQLNTGKVSIPIEDVISVCYPKHKNQPSSPQQVFPTQNGSPTSPPIDVIEDFRSININYAKRITDPKVQEGGEGASKTCKNQNIWRIYGITMHNNDKYIIKEWHDTLTKILSGKYLENGIEKCHKNHSFIF
jgi:hypothetical protein